MALNFCPKDRATQTVSATTVTASATVGATSDAVRIVNASGAIAFIRIGNATATSADMPMLNGTVEVFNKGAVTTIGVILASGAAGGPVYFTEGDGS